MNNPLWKRNKTKQTYMLLIVLILTVCLLGTLFFSKKKFNYVFDYSFFIVVSSSMEPAYPVNSLIIVKNESFENLKAGDVIVYKSDALRGGLAFHRIVEIRENGVYTKGDSNSYQDNQLITESSYVGKGVLYSYHLGRYIAAIRNPKGFALFLILPVLLIYLFVSLLIRFIKIWKSS